MRRRHLLTAAPALAAALVLSACTPGPDAAPTAPSTTPAAIDAAALLAPFDLTGRDGRELVDHLETLGGDDRPSELMASVRTDHLLLTTDAGEATLPLPADLFYVSVAPFAETTHECFYHSLTTCQGELVDTPVTLTVTDGDGTVVHTAETRTGANGFVGTWLPRGTTGTLSVTTEDGRTGQVNLGTSDNDPTCVTTLRVA